MRILALDFGERRIGVAISDPIGMLASPFGTLEAAGTGVVARRLREIVAENDVGEILVGLPVRTDGSESTEAARVREWARAIENQVGVTVTLVDERFSTRQAAQNLHAAGETAASMRERLDSAAAAIILQSYLDARRLRESDEGSMDH
jgi:putative Holliday junction resolvase